MLFGLPGMLAELVAGLAAEQADMAVVATLPPGAALEPVLQRTGAQVVVVGLDDSELPPTPAAALVRHPGLLVVGVSSRDGHAVLYELRPHAVPLGELSAGLLVDLVRISGST